MTPTDQWTPADIAMDEEAKAAAPRRRLRMEEAAPALSAADKNCVSDEMCLRLKEASTKCQENYASWRETNSGEAVLSDSLHELRRAIARIEIEIAASHSNDSALRPIPIPLHRAHK
jgi:hypothetical protein